MGACHVDLGAAYLGAYLGVGAYHLTGQNSYLGAYPGVGAYAGDYGMSALCHCLVVDSTFEQSENVAITR